jgi:hypothetical protein
MPPLWLTALSCARWQRGHGDPPRWMAAWPGNAWLIRAGVKEAM